MNADCLADGGRLSRAVQSVKTLKAVQSERSASFRSRF
jgi:hypothetical protein